MNPTDLARVICCEGTPCMRPESCDATKRGRVPVSPMAAANAVHRLYCDQWRAQSASRGPMSATRVLGERDE